MRLWRRMFNSWSEPAFWAQPRRLTPISSLLGDKERIENDFDAYVSHLFKENGVVFGCIQLRLMVFSEARFLWRTFQDGRPSRLFGNQDLALLERPWPNGTTGELLAHVDQDASLGGNFYATKVGTGANRRIRRLRPDWVTIVTGSRADPSDDKPDPFALDAEPIAYIYDPPRQGRRTEPTILDPADVVHYSPVPDPAAQWRGMSWLTPVVREVQADKAATEHKLNFFRNGATPGMAIAYDSTLSKEEVEEYIELFNEQHTGAGNAYRTLHLGGGADPKTVGANLEQMDFKVTQGAGETRIIMASGLHPVVVGASEGMQGASLNTGNFNSARRIVADTTFRPLWRIAAASLESLVEPPDAATQLWYDDRDVAFLREDAKDEADIKSVNASTISRLIDTGFEPDSAVRAVQVGDFSLLEHTGLVSVQLQPPGAESGDEATSVPANLAPTLMNQGWMIAEPSTNGQGALT